jgi:hypothetical protein
MKPHGEGGAEARSPGTVPAPSFPLPALHQLTLALLVFSLFSRRVDGLTDLTSPRQNFESFRDFEGQNQGNPGGGSTSRCGSVVINTQSYLLTR